jgi:hypothetical protein
MEKNQQLDLENRISILRKNLKLTSSGNIKQITQQK